MDLKTINGRRTILKYEVGGLNTALSDAIRKGISLDNADLIGTNLSWMNLSGANLTGANLATAILIGADLKDANLKGAFLEGAKNIPYIPLACPSEGAFTAWKKVEGKYLVKLQIPEDARRSSATPRNAEIPRGGAIKH